MNETQGPKRPLYQAPASHVDPYGAEFGIACIQCGRVHRTRTERRDRYGKVVATRPGSFAGGEDA